MKQEQIDRILEARAKLAAGDFDHVVVERFPEELTWDRVILDCGHRSIIRPESVETKAYCLTCAENFMKPPKPGPYSSQKAFNEAVKVEEAVIRKAVEGDW